MNFELYLTLAAAALLVGSNYVDVKSLLGKLKGTSSAVVPLADQVKMLRYHFALCEACSREAGMEALDAIDKLLVEHSDGQ